MPDQTPPEPHRYHTRVENEWLDYNGHMNVAFYTMAFDKAGEMFVADAGLSEQHTRSSGDSWMVTEAHITYQNEALAGEELEIASQMLALDSKRLHLFQRMLRRSDGTLLATNEQLILHVNLKQRRVSPFAPQVMQKLQDLLLIHSRLEHPAEAGRAISITSRRPAK